MEPPLTVAAKNPQNYNDEIECECADFKALVLPMNAFSPCVPRKLTIKQILNRIFIIRCSDFIHVINPEESRVFEDEAAPIASKTNNFV